MKRVAIIGAGACGLWTAIALLKGKQKLAIDLFERFDNVGKKIAMSGNSKGNVSNINIRASAYNNPTYVAPLIRRYNAKWALDSFESFGIKVLVDEAGRVYPISENAKSVVMTMKDILQDEHVCMFENHPINDIGFDPVTKIYTIDGQPYHAVVLATGSNAGMGPKVPPSSLPTINNRQIFKQTRRFPALCAIGVTDDVRLIENVRVKCNLTLLLGEVEYGAKGEVQFISGAISGIAAFVLSSFIARSMVSHGQIKTPALLVLDLMPSLSYKQLRDYLATYVDGNSFNRYSLTGLFHQNLSTWIFNRYQDTHQARFDGEKLTELIKNMPFAVDAKYIAHNNQVLAGGVDTFQVDNQTLECIEYPNLYIGGEALDIDGLCGGYNLHYAFASGEAIAQAIIKKTRN